MLGNLSESSALKQYWHKICQSYYELQIHENFSFLKGWQNGRFSLLRMITNKKTDYESFNSARMIFICG